MLLIIRKPASDVIISQNKKNPLNPLDLPTFSSTTIMKQPGADLYADGPLLYFRYGHAVLALPLCGEGYFLICKTVDYAKPRFGREGIPYLPGGHVVPVASPLFL